MKEVPAGNRSFHTISHAVSTRRPSVATAVLLQMLVFSALADAQSFSLGGRIGAGPGTVWFEDAESRGRTSILVGHQFGALVAYDLSSVFSMQLELSYTQKGWTEGQNDGGRRLTYLELPLLFAVNVPWTTSPHLLLGPTVSYEIGCSVTGVPAVGSVGCDDHRVEWNRNKTQFGIRIGLGIGRPVGRGKLELQLLGDIGLTNVFNETLPRGDTRFVVVMMSAVYKIPIGR